MNYLSAIDISNPAITYALGVAAGLLLAVLVPAAYRAVKSALTWAQAKAAAAETVVKADLHALEVIVQVDIQALEARVTALENSIKAAV